MVGWHHQLDEHEFEQAQGVGDGQGSLACCSPWGHKESDMTERLNWTECIPWCIQMLKNLPAMWETQVQSLSQEDHMELGVVSHSNILPWRIPWTGDRGGLQSMGSQRVLDWATSIFNVYWKAVLKTSPVAQLVNYLPAMQEIHVWSLDIQVPSLGQEDPLEEEMATHSSMLAWKIPWTEVPGGLKFIGSQRVGHDWTTNTFHFF